MITFQNIRPLSEIKTKTVATLSRLSQPLENDSVEISPQARLTAHSNKIFSRMSKFTIQDYKALSGVEKAVLRQVNSSVKDAAEDTVKVALKVKEKLDKNYGEDKYVFCCIGTSPSGIARALEFMGVETKYLPISQLKAYYEDDSYRTLEDKFGPYQKFLEEQGLDAKTVSDSDKEYLFYDYIYSGQSLSVFKSMMKEYFGLNLPNVNFHSADFLCYSSCAKKIDPPKYAIDYVHKYMAMAEIAEIGGVPHLPLAEIDKIDECKFYENRDAKLFNFTLIDILSKKSLLKDNPLNKTAL